jgi:hypothetical protein
MESRDDLKKALDSEYQHWDTLIRQISPQKWDVVLEGYDWKLKDVLAHLMSWQQVSNARLSAGLLEEAPEYPKWLEGGDPDTESDEITDAYNARIYGTYCKVPRLVVIESWRDGFLSLVKTVDALSDEALFIKDAFDWLAGHALIEVVEGTLNHHREHYEALAGILME